MQILESSMLGLRTARMVLRSREFGACVTLFPMVHVGEEAFYREVYDDAFSHDVTLVEGIRSPVTRNLTRSYRWIDLARLGLVLQPRSPAQDGVRARIVQADLNVDEFHREWRKVQLWLRCAIFLTAPLIGIHRRFFASRESLAHKMSLEDRRSAEEILSFDPQYQALEHSILGARDRRLIERLAAELERRGEIRIAVVYGARHMRAVLAELTKRGFVAAEATWRTVFRLENGERG